MDKNKVIYGDCIEEMKKMPKNSIDSIVTDPPYGLAFMGKSWDKFSPKEFQEFSKKWGEQALRVLKPGGYLLAFCGTRTYHRMVVGLEDVGFVIKDQVSWMYGSGFPKSHNIWKIDLKPKIEKQLR
ncbi:MAG: DNA methyltransferase, partial [Cyclobacterium sp.]|uniref:DNA methyltransferase n=1 Tax=Cyclobacterium sp. TaxID=1966343 RepID=UPI0039708A9A